MDVFVKKLVESRPQEELGYILPSALARIDSGPEDFVASSVLGAVMLAPVCVAGRWIFYRIHRTEKMVEVFCPFAAVLAREAANRRLEFACRCLFRTENPSASALAFHIIEDPELGTLDYCGDSGFAAAWIMLTGLTQVEVSRVDAGDRIVLAACATIAYRGELAQALPRYSMPTESVRSVARATSVMPAGAPPADELTEPPAVRSDAAAAAPIAPASGSSSASATDAAGSATAALLASAPSSVPWASTPVENEAQRSAWEASSAPDTVAASTRNKRKGKGRFSPATQEPREKRVTVSRGRVDGNIQ